MNAADPLRGDAPKADASRAAVVRRKVKVKVVQAGRAEEANDLLEDVRLADSPGKCMEGLFGPAPPQRHPIRADREVLRLADGRVKVTAAEPRRGRRQGHTARVRDAHRASIRSEASRGDTRAATAIAAGRLA